MKNKDLAIIGAAVLIPILLLSKKKNETAGQSYLNNPSLPRGIRNNNPGNIVLNGEKWKGEIPGVDTRFKTFENIVWGTRAIFVNLRNYYFERGLKTIRGIISRWAPTGENETAKYIATVSAMTGINADSVLSWGAGDFKRIAKAISIVENGSIANTIITDNVLQNAWSLL